MGDGCRSAGVALHAEYAVKAVTAHSVVPMKPIMIMLRWPRAFIAALRCWSVGLRTSKSAFSDIRLQRATEVRRRNRPFAVSSGRAGFAEAQGGGQHVFSQVE
jgi:hypothetical protein